MPANNYTTTKLFNNILLVAHMPAGNNTFTSAQVINLADRELQTSIVAQVQSTRGGYWLDYTDLNSTIDGLYPLPEECVAGTLEHIELVQGNSVSPVEIIEQSEQFSTTVPTSTGSGAFLRGNNVQILPFPNQTVRLWYLRRPSHLVPVSEAAQITNVNGAIVTVAALPGTFTIGTIIDVMGDKPPFHILGRVTITNIQGTDITLSSVVPNLANADWLALKNQTPVPQIPVEFRPLLEQRVVVKMYEMQGFIEKMKVAEHKLEKLEEDTFKLITPRVKSKAKVIPAGLNGFLRGGRFR